MVSTTPATPSGTPSGPDEPNDVPIDPGVPVDVGSSSSALSALQAELDAVEQLGASELLDRYPIQVTSELGFDPSQATHLDLVQDSTLALSEGELQRFQEHGFVIANSTKFPTFSYGYHSVYAADLPVFVSADSVLDAVHRSYDDVLKALELELLIPTLRSYLAGMRSAVATRDDLDLQVRKDSDFFLAVAESLLREQVVEPSFDGSFDPATVQEFYDAARAAQGIIQKDLFGVRREIDFSQFKARGHYTESATLSSYFQATMWLGRIDLRLVETSSNGERVLRRRQVEAALALRELMDATRLEQWRQIDHVVTAFVGEHDYMTVEQVDALYEKLSIPGYAELHTVDDATLAAALLESELGEQRIASHVIRKRSLFDSALPLSRSFALFGQRYVVDSHVFSQVVYDRVSDRVMPNPLDAAFAALGNNLAAHLLQPELEQFSFAGNLAAMRVLVDAHPADSWGSSLYTAWLGALRELSAHNAAGSSAANAPAPTSTSSSSAASTSTSNSAPAPTSTSSSSAASTPPSSDMTASEPQPGQAPITPAAMPAVARTEAWGRRLLNTQLGSWAQLRHDTLLYAKQSYTASASCEFPDAYVDPYPEFWAKLVHFAERGVTLSQELLLQAGSSNVLERAADYFARLAKTARILLRMAEHQRTGLPHSAEDLQFINNAVRISGGGSGPPSIEGWYHQLLFSPSEFADVDNVVADVHTDPGGELPIARQPDVLHVGTGYPRLMVVAVETCDGARAYTGPVFSYKEYRPGALKRLDDEEWSALLNADQAPGDPAWLQPVVAE